MKTTKAGIVDLVRQLFEINETKKAAEKAEKEIKAVLREFMGTEAVLEAGSYFVTIETRHRNDLDRKALVIDLGLEQVSKYMKHLEYEVMSVKQSKVGG